jgi:hypothetical protein
VPIKFTQSLTELLKVGWREASKYAAILGLTPTETAEFEAYIKLWDQLRICCGVQMSATGNTFRTKPSATRCVAGSSTTSQASAENLTWTPWRPP